MADYNFRLQFLGAAGYVTGSRALIETPKTKFYVDCGLYQGPAYVEEKNYSFLNDQNLDVDAVILTHAHIDHSGLLPLLVKKGFEGKIFCTPATLDLLSVILPDAGRLNQEEFKHLSKKKIAEYRLTGPIYTEADAIKTLDYVEVIGFNLKKSFQDIQFEYHWAGHILGAAHAEIEIDGQSILFSGDIGPRKNLLHKDRDKPPQCDFVVMESTYGAHNHEKDDPWQKMIKVVKKCLQRKGMLIVPAFAIGRSQLVLYILYRLMKEKQIPSIPVFIDSPMATKATRMYLQYPDEIKKEIIDQGFYDFIQNGGIELVESTTDSKKINDLNGPGVIISASGMCHGGRVLNHLHNRLWDRRNIILFVGYQAEGTLGRILIEGTSRVKVLGDEIPVRASITSINSFSAHADFDGLIDWASNFRGSDIKKLFINHGEDESRQNLKKELSFIDDKKIEMPKSESVYYL